MDTLVALGLALLVYPAAVLMVAITGPHSRHEIQFDRKHKEAGE
ncbi:hypothetical protein [Sphingobium sp. HDIP04]|nr:hypothetical protein [Sphingobium sp. HDIP04]EQB03905.1 hypothetical protein L286_11105 [Sphingobium sp. HDIP04]